MSTQQMQAFIVEDEPIGLENIKSNLHKHCPHVEVVGEATTLAEAGAWLSKQKKSPDVVFLDINLPDGEVFQLLDQLEELDFSIIFITGSEKHALQAFKYSSIDYILKPINPDILSSAVHRASNAVPNFTKEKLEILLEQQANPNDFNKICISTHEGVYFLKVSEIVRCLGDDNYTHIFVKDGRKITTSKTIKHYEGMFANCNFYRVHKRHLININHIKRFVRSEGGYILMEDDAKVDVSRRRRAHFMEFLKKFQEPVDDMPSA